MPELVDGGASLVRVGGVIPGQRHRHVAEDAGRRRRRGVEAIARLEGVVTVQEGGVVGLQRRPRAGVQLRLSHTAEKQRTHGETIGIVVQLGTREDPGRGHGPPPPRGTGSHNKNFFEVGPPSPGDSLAISPHDVISCLFPGLFEVAISLFHSYKLLCEKQTKNTANHQKYTIFIKT